MNMSSTVISSDPAKEIKEATRDLISKEADGTVFTPIEAIAEGQRIGNGVFILLKTLLLLAIRGFIAPCEVIFHYAIGERYFNFWVVLSCAALTTIPFAIGRIEEGLVAVALFAIFSIGARIHSLVCFIRDRFGGYWHSYFEGISWFQIEKIDKLLNRWHFTFDFSKLVLEPIIVGSFYGIIIQFFIKRGHEVIPILFCDDLELSLKIIAQYFACAAIGMFIYQLYCWSERRRVLLDEKDARALLEAKVLATQTDLPLGIHSHRGVAYMPPSSKLRWKITMAEKGTETVAPSSVPRDSRPEEF